jgi:SAM-dependent methyltransferase
MVGNDYDYFKRCFDLGLVRGRLLEIGSAKIDGQSGNICDIARPWGLTCLGADISAASGVDIVADFSADNFASQWTSGQFDTVVIFNVLEHTFDPITVLRNAVSCLNPGGWTLIVVPSIWPIHNFPGDYSRLLPNWFEEFARRQRLEISDEAFCWLSQFGIATVGSLVADGQYQIPSFLNLGRRSGRGRYWRSRIGHRVLNSYGRSHWFGHCAVAAALHKPATYDSELRSGD